MQRAKYKVDLHFALILKFERGLKTRSINYAISIKRGSFGFASSFLGSSKPKIPSL